MTTAQSCWQRLHAQTDQARSVGSVNAKNQILRILTRLADKEHCSRKVQGWIQHERGDKKKRLSEIRVNQGADARDNWKRPSIQLHNLVGLEDGAVLSLMVTLGDRDERIISYSVSLQGRQRPSGVPWYARIDLSEKPEGSGLCAHPLLHCHVGNDPDGEVAEVEPRSQAAEDLVGSPGQDARSKAWSPRVPLPWLYPWEALEWLLATVEPSLEPAPLNRASA